MPHKKKYLLANQDREIYSPETGQFGTELVLMYRYECELHRRQLQRKGIPSLIFSYETDLH